MWLVPCWEMTSQPRLLALPPTLEVVRALLSRTYMARLLEPGPVLDRATPLAEAAPMGWTVHSTEQVPRQAVLTMGGPGPLVALHFLLSIHNYSQEKVGSSSSVWKGFLSRMINTSTATIN